MAPYQFFKQPIFKEIGLMLHHRYYLNENFGKSIGLKRFSGIDQEPLRQFLGITTLKWSTQKSISLDLFEENLLRSAVHWSLEEFVNQLVGPLVSKSNELTLQEEKYRLFLDRIDQSHPLFQKNLTEKQLKSWFNREDDSIIYFEQVGLALEQLPRDYTRLPVFSYQVTKNAHTFDVENPAGKLLIQLLTALIETEEVVNLSKVEEENDVLKQFFLLRDDINNYVTIYGLIGYKKKQMSQMWYHACLEKSSWNVPLKEILKMDTIESMNQRPILIVENSGIYSILIDHFTDIPMICSSGQFSNAVWQLLRKLEKSNQQFLYVGDLDPDGLLMAQKIIDAFPENARIFSMSLENYQSSRERADISDQQVKKLRGIKDSELKKIADEIEKTKEKGYQEGFLEELISEIKVYYSAYKVNPKGNLS
ncbi:TIGR02679 domain-containing protein [Vagococcus carniphilus]|uniref:TIGR02679 domain-containing protein n=1 Tax=Vagococcus carniphilus TaxID=218144 RepID=UPI00288C9896|nr:TIGR02679 domain-containing protein [Vagococcus carniphilus]MDT2830246.1 TIGR02679 domain-containing protein [Vagococcus carniphilus]MDT2838678.1 TIGR02679 domain-containing protein [Vagococcus carniphilus]MDT2853516.1 TIGR02679 domain-containing protein [Vagococcus carniphilus]